jgi:hypothetical protein
MQVSQKLIFSVEKLLNPSPTDSIKSLEIPKTAPLLNGKALYNFGAIKLDSTKNCIKNLTASLDTNYSAVKKQINPITRLQFFTVSNNNLSFLNSISESKLTETNFTFSEVNLNSFSDTNSTNFQLTTNSKYPENIIEFNCTVIDNPTNNDYPDELPYLPIAIKNRPTILSGMQGFYAISFQEYINIPDRILIPDQSEYVLIFPYVTIPVPPSITRSGVTRISHGTISISILLNFQLEKL